MRTSYVLLLQLIFRILKIQFFKYFFKQILVAVTIAVRKKKKKKESCSAMKRLGSSAHKQQLNKLSQQKYT